MRSLYIAIFLFILSLLAACIETYDVSMEDTSNEILIVEGQIVGGTECEFILQRSQCKVDGSGAEPKLIAEAAVYVISSDGEVYGAERRKNGHYYANLDELDPNATYHLQIQLINDGVYESEPMHPLPTPEIRQLSFTMDDGETVHLRLSNEDPDKETYYLWTYDEHWEINTPLVTEWYYDRSSNSILRLNQDISRGWCTSTSHPLVLGDNLDYGNGALHDYEIYSLSNLDHRFNTRYHTKVHQIAITKSEYEYYKQLEAQSTQTGGIFTPMPAQLPTNIHNEKGLKAQGYVGVHLNSSDAELYINRKDVGYHLTDSIEIINNSVVNKKFSWLGAVYDTGYRIYHYNSYLGESEWTRPWCIDCRDEYWGASLDRPDFWQDN